MEEEVEKEIEVEKDDERDDVSEIRTHDPRSGSRECKPLSHAVPNKHQAMKLNQETRPGNGSRYPRTLKPLVSHPGHEFGSAVCALQAVPR